MTHISINEVTAKLNEYHEAVKALEESKTKITDLDILADQISRFDRYYHYSDDSSVYRAAKMKQEELMKKINEWPDPVRSQLKLGMSTEEGEYEQFVTIFKDNLVAVSKTRGYPEEIRNHPYNEYVYCSLSAKEIWILENIEKEYQTVPKDILDRYSTSLVKGREVSLDARHTQALHPYGRFGVACPEVLEVAADNIVRFIRENVIVNDRIGVYNKQLVKIDDYVIVRFSGYPYIIMEA